jgi:hypothetical protein
MRLRNLLAIAWMLPVAAASAQSLPTLEAKEWVGQRFVLLPKPPKLRANGYLLLEPHLPYAPWAGKTLTVTEVVDGKMPEVTFRADDGTIVHGTAYGGQQIDGLAPLRDIDYARAKWRGKTLWLRGTDLLTWNESTEKFGSVKVKKYSPVQVVDVVPSFFTQEPIRLVLRGAGGESGFLDVNVSGTNISKLLREFSHFDDQFYEHDPRTTFPWPKEVWDAIESEKVVAGMTAEQATMSWGKPKEIKRTVTSRGDEELWVYRGANALYVANGKVTAVQTQ